MGLFRFGQSWSQSKSNDGSEFGTSSSHYIDTASDRERESAKEKARKVFRVGNKAEFKES